MNYASSMPAGVAFARFVRALAIAKGDSLSAEAFARGQGWERTTAAVPDALKGLIDPLTMDGGQAALRVVFRDFAEALRPKTIVGRLQGLRRIPFSTRLLRADEGTGAGWAGEGQPIIVSSMTLNDSGEQLLPLKVGGISALTLELVRNSQPIADGVVAADVTAAIASALDSAFIDPANGGTADVKPASVSFGATSFESVGSTVAAIDADLKRMLAVLTGTDHDLSTAHWIMHPDTAVHLSLARNGDGGPAFPGTTARGGTLLGLPIVTSTACAASGSPSEKYIVLAEASSIAIADDGEAELEVSDRAALQMDSAPASGAQQLVSLWQHGLTAVKGVRFLNWSRRRAGAVATLRSVAY